MSDHSPIRSAHSSDFSARERWKIIMMHEIFFRAHFHPFNDLRIFGTSEREDREYVCSSAVKKPRAMKAFQKFSRTGKKRAHLVKRSPVGTTLVYECFVVNDAIDLLMKEFFGTCRSFFGERFLAKLFPVGFYIDENFLAVFGISENRKEVFANIEFSWKELCKET